VGLLLNRVYQLENVFERLGAKVLQDTVNQIKRQRDSFLLVHTNSIFATAEMGQRRDPITIMPQALPKAKVVG
jgi:hypothetical protein